MRINAATCGLRCQLVADECGCVTGNLQVLDLGESFKIYDKTLVKLRGSLPNLEALSLTRGHISPEGLLQPLETLTCLTRLSLSK